MPGADHQLLQAWGQGDASAGQLLVRRHYDAIYLFFHARLDPDLSADLTQSTFETLFAKRDSFRGESEVRTFVFGIARWKLLDHLRKRSTGRGEPVPFDEGLTAPASDRSLSSLLHARRQESLVVKALRSLPVDEQILLELKDYEGMTGKAMAEIFGVPRGTIATRIRRARGRLAEAVQSLAEDPTQVTPTITDLDEHMKRIRSRLNELIAQRR